jgi:hypothetical protein
MCIYLSGLLLLPLIWKLNLCLRGFSLGAVVRKFSLQAIVQVFLSSCQHYRQRSYCILKCVMKYVSILGEGARIFFCLVLSLQPASVFTHFLTNPHRTWHSRHSGKHLTLYIRELEPAVVFFTSLAKTRTAETVWCR